MIQVHYFGSSGNNLFQYCLGRILASELGYQLYAESIIGFPNTAKPVTGADYSELPPVILAGQYVDLHTILSRKSPQHIILAGYFQRYEYYSIYRESIRNYWLTLDRTHPIQPGAAVVHVRRGDYVSPYFRAALPFSYYCDAIENCSYDRLYICTDDPSDGFVKKLGRRYGAEMYHGSAMDDFRFISSCGKIVLSQSSYSWWAAYLSDAEEIYVPIPKSGYWASDDIDLMVDEERYKYIFCNDVYRLSMPEIFRYYKNDPKRLVYHSLRLVHLK